MLSATLPEQEGTVPNDQTSARKEREREREEQRAQREGEREREQRGHQPSERMSDLAGPAAALSLRTPELLPEVLQEQRSVQLPHPLNPRTARKSAPSPPGKHQTTALKSASNWAGNERPPGRTLRVHRKDPEPSANPLATRRV
eukprot:321074-Rhodomonas_salina.1